MRKILLLLVVLIGHVSGLAICNFADEFHLLNISKNESNLIGICNNGVRYYGEIEAGVSNRTWQCTDAWFRSSGKIRYGNGSILNSNAYCISDNSVMYRNSYNSHIDPEPGIMALVLTFSIMTIIVAFFICIERIIKRLEKRRDQAQSRVLRNNLPRSDV